MGSSGYAGHSTNNLRWKEYEEAVARLKFWHSVPNDEDVSAVISRESGSVPASLLWSPVLLAGNATPKNWSEIRSFSGWLSVGSTVFAAAAYSFALVFTLWIVPSLLIHKFADKWGISENGTLIMTFALIGTTIALIVGGGWKNMRNLASVDLTTGLVRWYSESFKKVERPLDSLVGWQITWWLVRYWETSWLVRTIHLKTNYELNAAFSDGRRIRFWNSWHLDEILAHAEAFSQLSGKPVWTARWYPTSPDDPRLNVRV